MTPGKGSAITTARRLLNPQRALAWLIVLVAVMNFIIVFFLTPLPRTLIKQGDLTIYVDPDYAFPAMKMRIAVALLIGGFAVLFSGLKTRVLSIVALTWALVEYGLWIAVTYRWIRSDGSRVKHLLSRSGFWTFLSSCAFLRWRIGKVCF